MIFKGENLRAVDLRAMIKKELGAQLYKTVLVKTNKPNDKGTVLIVRDTGAIIYKDKSNHWWAEEALKPSFCLKEKVKSARPIPGMFLTEKQKKAIPAGVPYRRDKETKLRLNWIRDAFATIKELNPEVSFSLEIRRGKKKLIGWK